MISFSHVLSEATVPTLQRQPTVFAFLFERCALYARTRESSLFKHFLGSLSITTESIERFQSRKYCFRSFDSKVLSIIKHNYVQGTGLARLKAMARVSILSL